MGGGSGGKKVVATFHEGFVGGATTSVLRALPELEQRGWEFAFWVDRPSDVYDQLAARGHTVDGLPRHVGFSRQWLRRPPGPAKLRHTPGWFAGWARFLRRERPDVVHANTLYTLPEALIARSLGIPVFFHVHEMLTASVKARQVPRLVRATGMEAAAVSRASAAALGRGRFAPRVVYESSVLPPAPRPAPVDGEKLVVGTVGWVCPRKGTDVFIDAARRVMAELPGVEVRLVGPTSPNSHEWPWMQARVTEAREAGITYLPSADVFAQLQEWDLFVLCSRYDPFPLVVLEALASGVPVVGTRVDGIAEQLTPECGLLAEPEDAEDVARRIVELLRDPARRRAMGAAGRERVAQNFTDVHQARGIDEAYRAAIGMAA